MTSAEFDAVAARLEALIAAELALKKRSDQSLADKVVHSRVAQQLREMLRQHRLNRFELVPAG